MSLNKSNDISELKGFDVDLEFGNGWEKYIDDIFKSAKKAEIKTERNIWTNTGNIAIEYECSGKPSGLRTTEADVWIHNLVFNEEIYCSFIFPINKFKKLCNKMFEEKNLKNGGDGGNSKLLLLHMKEMIDNFRLMATEENNEKL